MSTKPPPPMPLYLSHSAKSSPSQSSSLLNKPEPLNPLARPFQPCALFFYGTLQDPDLLEQILDLPSRPSLRKAQLLQGSEQAEEGYKMEMKLEMKLEMKMWGVYPAIVRVSPSSIPASTQPKRPDFSDTLPSTTSPIVHGAIWYCASATQFSKLEAYETGAYTWCECAVRLDEGGEVLNGCRMFCWAGEAQSRELDPGMFDYERWVRGFKASVVRRR